MAKKVRKQREFWKHNINPITGWVKITINAKPGDAETFAHPNDKFITLHA